MQAPHPVHLSSRSSGVDLPPTSRRKCMADSSQLSLHVRHITRRTDRQLSVKLTIIFQALSFALLMSALGSHTLSHLPQKVHSFWLKSTTGSLPRPNDKMFVGQMSIHLPQFVQVSSKISSGTAQGGRNGNARPATSPESNWRRSSWVLFMIKNVSE